MAATRRREDGAGEADGDQGDDGSREDENDHSESSNFQLDKGNGKAKRQLCIFNKIAKVMWKDVAKMGSEWE